MPTSPRYGFDYLEVGETVPSDAVNEALERIEAGGGHFIFKDRIVDPTALTPAAGDTYLIDGTGAGDWTGHDNEIAYYLNTGWVYFTPIEGFTAWVNDTNEFIGYNGATWDVIATPAGTYIPLSYLDTDDTLAADSDVKVPSQQAVKAYVASAVTGLLDFKGSTDASANPNYPSASKGDTYLVSVAGKIGGASGTDVEISDVYIATADNAGGTQAAVGTSWSVLQGNVFGGAVPTDLDDLADVDTTGVADGDVLTYDSGAGDWVPAAPTGGGGGGGGFDISPPDTTLFSLTNLGTSVGLGTGYDANKGLTIYRTDTGASANERLGFQGKAVPGGTGWVAEMTIRHMPISMTSSTHYRSGLCLLENSTGKHIIFGINSNNNSPNLTVMYWSAIGTYSSTAFSIGIRAPVDPMRYRITESSTQYVLDVSFDDGVTYKSITSLTKAGYFTADRIGLALQSFNAVDSGMNRAQILYYAES